MLKSILNLEGAQGLSKNEQKKINGGSTFNSNCRPINHPNTHCENDNWQQMFYGNEGCYKFVCFDDGSNDL